jgi:23S rRNA (cytidine1920-2'-O)/16S rRNA (cytidine1409-2'-O)-methyltransferase
MKKRIDITLVEKNISPTREKAKQMIKWGFVKINGIIITKPSKIIDSEDKIELIQEIKYVSRAGYKLEKALNKFKINVSGMICLDIGSSTGGFVDCLIQNNAKKVYALEIAKNQLDKKIAENEKVVNMEGVDVRKEFSIPEKIDFCSIDANFVSVEDILLKIKDKLKQDAEIVALIKPPFEKEFWKGIKAVRKNEEYKSILKNLNKWGVQNNFIIKKIISSPIKGKEAKQNEFLAYIKIKQ